jgi:hypothetical protein
LKVQRLSLTGVQFERIGSALHHTHQLMNGDDIVHPFRKLLDMCNRLVAGSNPAAGATKKITMINMVIFYSESIPQEDRLELLIDFSFAFLSTTSHTQYVLSVLPTKEL